MTKDIPSWIDNLAVVLLYFFLDIRLSYTIVPVCAPHIRIKRNTPGTMSHQEYLCAPILGYAIQKKATIEDRYVIGLIFLEDMFSTFNMIHIND